MRVGWNYGTSLRFLTNAKLRNRKIIKLGEKVSESEKSYKAHPPPSSLGCKSGGGVIWWKYVK